MGDAHPIAHQSFTLSRRKSAILAAYIILKDLKIGESSLLPSQINHQVSGSGGKLWEPPGCTSVTRLYYTLVLLPKEDRQLELSVPVSCSLAQGTNPATPSSPRKPQHQGLALRLCSSFPILLPALPLLPLGLSLLLAPACPS